MQYRRMPIEVESPEELGYGTIACNLAESSIWDGRFGDWSEGLDGLVLCYGEHRGKLGLRESIAARNKVHPNDVLVVPGAAAGLFMVHTALLGAETSLVVARPNYGTNLETPRILPCTVHHVDLRFENRFELDLNEVKALIQPDTRLISVTYPHNPTGVILSEAKLRALIELAEEHRCYLMVDETYRDLHLVSPAPPAASLSKNVISVSSLSKAFGLPGIRMGWIVCQNPELREIFLAAKEQIYICTSVIDEEIAHRCLLKSDTLLHDIRKQVLANFQTVSKWMAGQRILEWIAPQGGVVCLPRVKPEISIDTKKFYDVLLSQYSTYVGPGHWFGLDDRYFRLGFGWEPPEKLAIGLENISKALEATVEANHASEPHVSPTKVARRDA